MSVQAGFDFVVVGSGAASVCAALAAQAAGAKPLIIEKTDRFGGSTALSGGVLWLPNNPAMKRAGVTDSYADGRTYLDACAKEVGPASSAARREAFLKQGPPAIEFLEQLGMKFFHSEGWSDYHEGEYPGGVARGRSFEADMFDLREIGEWAGRLRRHEGGFSVPISVPEMGQVNLNGKTLKSRLTFIKVGWRMMQNRFGRDLVRMGAALQGRLLQIALRQGIPIWLDTPVKDFVVQDGRVVGVRVNRAGQEVQVDAGKGVLIDAGGFSRNEAMRRKFQPPGTTADWTVANPGDTGEVLELAMRLGAATDLLEESWWIPSSRLPDGTQVFNNPLDMAKPHCIMVDSRGDRYVDEATSYVAVGLAMYERNRTVPAIPSWLIIESRHRNSYRWGAQAPGEPPPEWISSGYMKRAATIEDLAQQCGIDVERLRGTVSRFNDFARRGVDADFGRGASAYHRFWGDPTVKPNPNLGTLERGPFYAVKVYVGDVGTCGGLLTDEHGRVLDEKAHAPIAGLYATGNSTASVMGRSYPGAGASIAASLIFGFIAARHAAGHLPRNG